MFQPFTLHDGRRLLIREIRGASDVWVVFLPGSSAEIWDFDWAELRALFDPMQGRANLLVINKPGMLPNGKVQPRAFEASFRRDRRVRDYLEVMRRCVPKSARIFLLGFSEGAYLAPEVALHDSRVRALSLISGGTRSWIDEEILKPCALNLGPVFRRVGRIYARPHSTSEHWFGISHATFTSYDNDRTLESLEKLNRPILAIHSDRDVMIDLDSARGDLLRLKREGKDITLRLFEGVDHTLEHLWYKALRASGMFFRKQALAGPRRQTPLVISAHR